MPQQLPVLILCSVTIQDTKQEWSIIIPQTVEAIYMKMEDGILRPTANNLEKLVAKQRKAMQELIGIGDSGLTNVSESHDKYIYQIRVNFV